MAEYGEPVRRGLPLGHVLDHAHQAGPAVAEVVQREEGHLDGQGLVRVGRRLAPDQPPPQRLAGRQDLVDQALERARLESGGEVVDAPPEDVFLGQAPHALAGRVVAGDLLLGVEDEQSLG